MKHHENNYFGAMMTISALQTDSKEGEAMEYVRSKECACYGSGIGVGFQNTIEKHVMKYKEAMVTDDKYDWEAAVE